LECWRSTAVAESPSMASVTSTRTAASFVHAFEPSNPPISSPRLVADPAWLLETVGNKPRRSWRDEWPQLRSEELHLTKSDASATPKSVERDDPLDGVAQRMKDRIEWKTRAGWNSEDAEAVTCISSSGLTALGRAVRESSGAYAACTHRLTRALISRASALTEPPVYRNLTGTFGLATVDPCWNVLVELDGSIGPSAVGLSFVTSTTAIASDSSSCFSPDGRGFCVPLKVNGKPENVLQESDVVCFRSAPADGKGFHSVVQTSASMYQLPPGTSITVEKVEDSGAWSAYGVVVKRRLFTVRATFGREGEVV